MKVSWVLALCPSSQNIFILFFLMDVEFAFSANWVK